MNIFFCLFIYIYTPTHGYMHILVKELYDLKRKKTMVNIHFNKCIVLHYLGIL
jgi:hypothetical protein